MKKEFELNRHNQFVLVGNSIGKQDNLYKLCLNIDYFDKPYSDIIEILKDIDNEGLPVDSTTIANRISVIKSNIAIHDILKLYESPIIFNFDEILSNVKQFKNKIKIESMATDYKNSKIDFESFFNQIQSIQLDANQFEELGLMGDYLEDPYGENKRLEYFKTGIDCLDNIVDGYFQGDLFIVAARPGLGKSSLALQTTLRHPFAYFSLEMPKKQLGHRLISMYTGIHIKKLRKGLLSEDDKKQVKIANENIKQISKIIPIDSKFNINDILITIKMLHKTGRIKGVVIDYLQLITGGKGTNENLRIGYITRNLKQLAVSLQMPIILLSQLSRDSDKTDREPQLFDLRESGNIEQDADIVLFIHSNKDERFTNVFKPDVRFIIAKHRNGEVAKLDGIQFDKTKYKFIEKEVDKFDTLNYIHV